MEKNVLQAKKALLALLAILMPVLANAEKVEIDGIWYNLNDNAQQAEVTFKGGFSTEYHDYSGPITIPAMVTYEGVDYSVIRIGEGAFEGCSNLTSIAIPEGVTDIEGYAFSSCNRLTTITIPENSQLTRIGDSAFSGCSSLYSFSIPENSQLTHIGERAFAYCGLVTTIIPKGVTSIENYVFDCCSSLTTITISEGVTSIGEGAFQNCNSLTDIIIPKSVMSIGNNAFRDCYSLNTISIPESSQLTSIGEWIFYNCSNLSSITIPASVTSICSDAFEGCNRLTTITVADGNPIYDSRNYCNAIIETNSNTLIVGCSATIIPESVTSIGYNAFRNCSSLTSITIPKGVTSIGEYAFVGCRSLANITISESTTSIGRGAFIDCENLTSITIPKGVTSIEDNVFLRCFSLVNITIPEGVTNIGEYAFDNCYNLTDITLPESMTGIGSNAFRNCNSLTNITLPKGITSIGYGAFRNCSAITTITCKAATPPSADRFTFTDVDKFIPIYIPKGAIIAYKSASYWNEFTNFIEVDFLEKCATPIIGYIDGKVSLTCETEDVEFFTEVVAENTHTYAETEFYLIPTYTLTAYATKDQYEDSDVATLTICWIPCEEHEEDDETTGILTIPSKPVLISASGGVLTLSGLAEGTAVALYTTNGTLVAQQQSSAGEAKFAVDTNQVYIVHIGDKVVKIGM